MTVEAALVLPLFLFFLLHLGSAMEMLRLHGNLELALWEVGNRLTVYGHVLGSGGGTGSAGADGAGGETPEASGEVAGVSGGKGTGSAASESFWAELAGVTLAYTYVKGQVMTYLGEEYLEHSPLNGGAASLQFIESDVREGEDTFEIVLTYSVSPFGSAAEFFPFRMANKYYGHLWNGYEIPTAAESGEQYVYVTDTGEVYHTSGSCTHLRISVEEVSKAQAQSSRNKQGERYSACELCCEGIHFGKVYITEMGDRYHYLRECSGLKRTVYRIPLTEARQYRPCSRCFGG